jgi:hypothetical protein
MKAIFLRDARYAINVGLRLRPGLDYFGKEMFKSRRGNIDEYPDWLIRIILETMDGAARGINVVARH